MEIFVTFYFILVCLSILLTTYSLCIVEYPIIKKIKKGEDTFKLIILIGLAIWTGILLFIGNFK